MPHIELISRAVWIIRDRVLLCRDQAGEYFYLPGGHVEFGESAAAALRREMVEETGLEVTVGPPLLLVEQTFIQDRQTRHEWTMVFHVEHPGTEVASREAGIVFEWVPLAAVTDLDIRPEPVRAWLAAGGRTDGMPDLAWLSMLER